MSEHPQAPFSYSRLTFAIIKLDLEAFSMAQLGLAPRDPVQAALYPACESTREAPDLRDTLDRTHCGDSQKYGEFRNRMAISRRELISKTNGCI